MPLREGLPKLPGRMQKLPIDARGYPVPYFVSWVNGVPDFRVIDPWKWQNCVRFRRCWICGELLGRWSTFCIGPKSAEHRLSTEPPSHLECAEFAVKACPFILIPTAKHRGVPDRDDVCFIDTIDPRNPGKYCLWTTDVYMPFPTKDYGDLIRLGDPREVTWYEKGKVVTTDQWSKL